MKPRSENKHEKREIRVMIVGPGPKTEGGITEVISRIYNQLEEQPGITACWIATHRSGNAIQKLGQVLIGLIAAIGRLPGSNIVHIHSSANVSFFRKTLFFGLAKMLRRPVIWHLHTPNEDFAGFFGRKDLVGWYGRFIIRRCDRIVLLSDSWLALASSVLPVDKVCVIYNPIPLTVRIDVSKRTVGEIRILYLAHLIQRKGYPLLIQAFAEVLSQYPDTRLVFAGSGEILEAKRLCEELKVRDNVDFLGWVGESIRARELQRASIFVLPSYQEGLPMGVLEAMAYGLAVITTPVGGIADVIQHGKNGRLIQPGDMKALSYELQSLLEDPETCGRLGSAARISVQGFAPQEIAQQWIKLYMSVLSISSDGSPF